jgi:hypothetical protein
MVSENKIDVINFLKLDFDEKGHIKAIIVK